MIPQLYKAHQGGRSGPTARTTLHSRNSREIKKESDDVNECVLPDLPALGWVVCVHTYRWVGWRSIKGSTSRWKKKKKKKEEEQWGGNQRDNKRSLRLLQLYEGRRRRWRIILSMEVADTSRPPYFLYHRELVQQSSKHGLLLDSSW